MNFTITSDGTRNISVHKGDTIEIQLDEVPTSGYAWEIDSLNNNVAELVSNEYKLYNEAGIGGGGKRILKFIVRNPGTGSIKLKNAQRWSGDVYKKFELDVSAQ